MCALSFTPEPGPDFFTCSVVSLIGVILIARPTALFGNTQTQDITTIGEGGPTSMDSAEKGTPRDRLIAVGYVVPFDLSFSVPGSQYFRH